MKTNQEDIKKLEEILIKRHSKKETVKISEAWQAKVMSHIRRLEPVNKTRQDNSLIFEQFLWRFAPVASALIVILVAVMLTFDFVSEYEMAKIFIDDPIEFSLVQSFLI